LEYYLLGIQFNTIAQKEDIIALRNHGGLGAKIDDLLGKLIKSKPLPEKKIKAPKKRNPRPIIGSRNS